MPIDDVTRQRFQESPEALFEEDAAAFLLADATLALERYFLEVEVDLDADIPVHGALLNEGVAALPWRASGRHEPLRPVDRVSAPAPVPRPAGAYRGIGPTGRAFEAVRGTSTAWRRNAKIVVSRHLDELDLLAQLGVGLSARAQQATEPLAAGRDGWPNRPDAGVK